MRLCRGERSAALRYKSYLDVYSRSTLKKLNGAVRAGCAVRSASLRQRVSETGSCGYGIASVPSADVTLILQDVSQVESL